MVRELLGVLGAPCRRAGGPRLADRARADQPPPARSPTSGPGSPPRCDPDRQRVPICAPARYGGSCMPEARLRPWIVYSLVAANVAMFVVEVAHGAGVATPVPQQLDHLGGNV